ncbi:MAG: LLM class F420-dependent oxidoreductase, partial [Nocardioidaceae bacterium]
VLDEWCAKVGRDPGEIERSSGVPADQLSERAPALYDVGTRLFTIGVGGPDYDLAPIRDIVAWRDEVNRD